MYAVIKTGGKQYRVQAGDLLVVEKLDGEPGAKIAFDQVLMIGEGASVNIGEPVIKGASVSATLVETRKGEKIKVFKKIRRQGYRRTRGHRQFQSVLRVTGIAGAGQESKWDGTVDLTPLSVLNARARNLARGMEAADAKRVAKSSVAEAPKAAKPAKPAAETPKAAKPEASKAETVTKAEAPKAAKPAAETPKATKPVAPKAEKATKAEASKAEKVTTAEAPKAAKPVKAAPVKAVKAAAPAAKAAPAKKPAAKKPAAKPAPKA